MKLIKRFTDNYKKNRNSNLGKLMAIFDFQIEQLIATFEKIRLYRAIDNADGVTLDNIGKNVLQERGGMDDVLYRLFLKVKIRANTSGGQIDTINDVLDVILGDHYLGLQEVWNDPTYENEPAAMEIRYINFFDAIKAQYKDNVNDLWYFDGKYSFNGERYFDGGYVFTFEEFEQKIIEAMAQTKRMINFIKAGGVKVWWCEPVEVVNAIAIDHAVIRHSAIKTIDDKQVDHHAAIHEVKQIINPPAFLFDGLYDLNGELYFDGKRPIIAHRVTVNEVQA